MKRLMYVLGIVCLLAWVGAALAVDDYVQPQTLDGIELYREVTAINYSTAVRFVQGAPILFTNMVCYSTADLDTNSVIQGLTGVTVEVAMSVSSSTTGTWQTATVQVASNGTWHITVDALPTASSIYWQCRLTDSVTNVYYYQQQILYADPHL